MLGPLLDRSRTAKRRCRATASIASVATARPGVLPRDRQCRAERATRAADRAQRRQPRRAARGRAGSAPLPRRARAAAGERGERAQVGHELRERRVFAQADAFEQARGAWGSRRSGSAGCLRRARPRRPAAERRAGERARRVQRLRDGGFAEPEHELGLPVGVAAVGDVEHERQARSRAPRPRRRCRGSRPAATDPPDCCAAARRAWRPRRARARGRSSRSRPRPSVRAGRCRSRRSRPSPSSSGSRAAPAALVGAEHAAAA